MRQIPPMVSCKSRAVAYKEVPVPKHQQHLEAELDRRLNEIETSETQDPVHAKLSGKSLLAFVIVVALLAIIPWVGVSFL